MFLIFAHLCVLVLSQKHGNDQFSMILRQFTSYFVSTIRTLLIYNTHLTDNRYENAIRAEKQNV